MSAEVPSEKYQSITIPKESLLQDYLASQSRTRNKALSGISLQGKLDGMFVEDQILVNTREEASIQFLVDQCGGTVLPVLPLPQKPSGLESARQRPLDGMPSMAVVSIKGENVALDAFDRIAKKAGLNAIRVASRAGAGTLAAKQLLSEKNLRGQLNLAGTPTGFPLLSSTEGFLGANDAFAWPEYAGKSNIAKAWQLCQAFSNVHAMKTPIYIAILDNGFGFVTPTDYSTAWQFNLTNGSSSVAGAGNVGGYAWHGSAVAGVAAAIVNNSLGGAGVGGIPVGPANQPVAVPFFFRTDVVIDEIYRCLQLCLAWGIDVVNMSFEIPFPKFFLPLDRDWDGNFQFAHDQGLIMIAGAGNDSEALPDNVVFPATRTPGTITVGALDATSNAARSDSNYGDSVDIWAPGTAIHTVPDPDMPQVVFYETSAAAPIISGMAALMRSINPALKPDDVKTILRETAWTDSPDSKSNRILNAYAALLRTMNFALPPGVNEEPNNAPETAKLLVTSAPNTLTPASETVISQASDVDYFHFNTTEYDSISITLTYVRPLGFVSMDFLPEDPDTNVFDGFSQTSSPGSQIIALPQAPPGSYRIKVQGGAPNYYKLSVSVIPIGLPQDMFELNETKDTAAHIILRKFNRLLDLPFARAFYPGTYAANIQNASDVDWYHITDIGPGHLAYASCRIKADLPLDIDLIDQTGIVIGSFAQVRQVNIHLPSPQCWVLVRGSKPTRYDIIFGYMLDLSKLPVLQQIEIEIVPTWWPDPAFEIGDWEKWLQIEIDDEMRTLGEIQLQANVPLHLELLSPDRSLLQTASLREDRQVLNVAAMATGTYLLRISRPEGAGTRFQPAQRAAVRFQMAPNLRSPAVLGAGAESPL